MYFARYIKRGEETKIRKPPRYGTAFSDLLAS